MHPNVEFNREESEAVKAIKNVFDLIPDKYNADELYYINLYKAATYNAEILSTYKTSSVIKIFLSRFYSNESIISSLGNTIQKIYNWNSNSKLKNKEKEEFPLLQVQKSLGRSYIEDGDNIFLASLPSYLLSISNFISSSQMKNNKVVIPRYLQHYHSIKQVNQKNIIIFEDLINNEILHEFNEAKRVLIKIFLKNEKFFHDNFSFSDYSLYPFFREGIKNLFVYTIPNSILYRLTAMSLLSRFHPNAVVCARQRRTFENAFMSVAKSYDVKKFMLIHGNIYNDKGWRLTFGHFTDLEGIFVWGQEQKNTLEEFYDTSGSNIYLVGSPIFLQRKGRLKKREEKLTVLFAIDKIEDFEDEINTTINILESSEINFRLILKLHPSVKSDLSHPLSRNKKVMIVDENHVIEDYFSYSDIFLTKASTTAIQAMVADIPTIILAFDKKSQNEVRICYKFNKVQEKHMVSLNSNEFSFNLKKIILSKSYLKNHKDLQKSFLDKNISNYSNPADSIVQISNIINNL